MTTKEKIEVIQNNVNQLVKLFNSVNNTDFGRFLTLLDDRQPEGIPTVTVVIDLRRNECVPVRELFCEFLQKVAEAAIAERTELELQLEKEK